MKLKHRRKQEKKHRTAEIPTGSFSDIAFLLIIYFIVMTTLVKVQSITADLPAGEKQAEAQIDKTPTVNLRGRDILVNDKPMSIEALNDALDKQYFDQKPADKKVVMLEAADDTPYSTYHAVLAAISSNGGVVALVEEED